MIQVHLSRTKVHLSRDQGTSIKGPRYIYQGPKYIYQGTQVHLYSSTQAKPINRQTIDLYQDCRKNQRSKNANFLKSRSLRWLLRPESESLSNPVLPLPHHNHNCKSTIGTQNRRSNCENKNLKSYTTKLFILLRAATQCSCSRFYLT